MPIIRIQKKKLWLLLAALAVANLLFLAIYLNFDRLAKFVGYSPFCPHLKGASCTRPEKIRLPGAKGEGVVLAYKTPPGTALYSPVDGSMMVFAKPFFTVKQGAKIVRLPGIIVYKLDDKGRAEYSIYFIAKHNIKRDRMTKTVKRGEKIAETEGNVYKDYSILVGADRFDKAKRRFVVDEKLLYKIFLETE